MRFKVVIFDLDDTLYNEFDFVKGGYGKVADYLSTKCGHGRDLIFSDMLRHFHNDGRNNLFDRIVKKCDIYEEGVIDKLLEIYRAHKPSISLYDDAAPTIKRLRTMGVKTGMITDGIKLVQQSKTKTLGLDKLMDHIIFTDDLGPGNDKPSTLPFKLLCGLLKINFTDACYIGDNPFKDFLAPNQMNMTSIRLKRGMYKDAVYNEEPNCGPAFTILSLSEIFLI